jgi:hypothetical protein
VEGQPDLTPAPTDRSYQWRVDGQAVGQPTASPQPYVVRAADAGKSIDLVMTATKDGYDPVTATSNALGPVQEGAFAVIGELSITGSPVVGSKLSVGTVPTYLPAEATVEWRWYRGTTAVGSVTAVPQAWTLVEADLGASMSLHATISKPGYASTTVVSNAVGPVQAATSSFVTVPTPVVTGTVKVGRVLTVTTGNTSPVASKITRQWLRDGIAIPGATASKYTLVNSDAGRLISVRVTYAASGYTTEVRESTPVAVPAKVVTAPSYTGVMRAGQTLTGSAGTWLAPGYQFTYQWLRNGTPISGATSLSYQLTSLDRGKTIKLRVIASKASFLTVTSTSQGRTVSF